jgi:hypothetical protein
MRTQFTLRAPLEFATYVNGVHAELAGLAPCIRYNSRETTCSRACGSTYMLVRSRRVELADELCLNDATTPVHFGLSCGAQAFFT